MRPSPLAGASITSAAAAALVLGLVRFSDFGGGSDEPPISTTLSDAACVYPRGEVPDFARFELDYELQPRWSVEIVVLDAGGAELLRDPVARRACGRPDTRRGPRPKDRQGPAGER